MATGPLTPSAPTQEVAAAVRYFRTPSTPCTFVTSKGKSLVATDGILRSSDLTAEDLAEVLSAVAIGSLHEVSKESADACAQHHAIMTQQRISGVL